MSNANMVANNTECERGFYHPVYRPYGGAPRRRKRVSSTQAEILEQYFDQTPRPSAVERLQLSTELDMAPRRVQIWFQNRRAKERKKKKSDEDAGNSSPDELEITDIPPSKRLSPSRDDSPKRNNTNSTTIQRRQVGSVPCIRGALWNSPSSNLPSSQAPHAGGNHSQNHKEISPKTGGLLFSSLQTNQLGGTPLGESLFKQQDFTSQQQTILSGECALPSLSQLSGEFEFRDSHLFSTSNRASLPGSRSHHQGEDLTEDARKPNPPIETLRRGSVPALFISPPATLPEPSTIRLPSFPPQEFVRDRNAAPGTVSNNLLNINWQPRQSGGGGMTKSLEQGPGTDSSGRRFSLPVFEPIKQELTHNHITLPGNTSSFHPGSGSGSGSGGPSSSDSDQISPTHISRRRSSLVMPGSGNLSPFSGSPWHDPLQHIGATRFSPGSSPVRDLNGFHAVHGKPSDERRTSFSLASARLPSIDSILMRSTQERGVSFSTDDQSYLLMEAIEANRGDEVEMLLQNPKINVNFRNSALWSPLHSAVRIGNQQIVKLLLNVKGINPNMQDREDQLSPLHIASLRGYHEIVQILLSSGARTDLEDVHQRTSLYHSCVHGYYQSAKFLIESGANMECKDLDGNTPLQAAALYGYHDIVELLIKRGAKVNLRDNNDHTALYYATRESHHQTAHLLRAHGATDDFPAQIGQKRERACLFQQSDF